MDPPTVPEVELDPTSEEVGELEKGADGVLRPKQKIVVDTNWRSIPITSAYPKMQSTVAEALAEQNITKSGEFYDRFLAKKIDGISARTLDQIWVAIKDFPARAAEIAVPDPQKNGATKFNWRTHDDHFGFVMQGPDRWKDIYKEARNSEAVATYIKLLTELAERYKRIKSRYQRIDANLEPED
jgi:hypothetical protein